MPSRAELFFQEILDQGENAFEFLYQLWTEDTSPLTSSIYAR